MSPLFQPATKEKSRARVALCGPSGSGKTYTALRLAAGLCKNLAVLNSESGAVQKYLGIEHDGYPPWSFYIHEPREFSPDHYIRVIEYAEAEGFDCLLIDSLSHAWAGKGGALAQVDNASGKNKFAAWKDVTPKHLAMIDAMLQSRIHIIATMRSKVEYVLEEGVNGKKEVSKKGMSPVQRDGMEYEFDVVADIDESHNISISKTRCPALDLTHKVSKPDFAFWKPYVDWLEDGNEPTHPSSKTPPPPPEPTSPPVQVSVPETTPTPAEDGDGNTPYEEQVDSPIDHERKEKIKKLFKGKDTEFLQVLGYHKVKKLSDLTRSQADEIIGNISTQTLTKSLADYLAGDLVPY